MFLYLDYIRDIIDNFAKFNNSHRKAYFRGKVHQHDNEYNKHFSTTTKNPRILEFILSHLDYIRDIIDNFAKFNNSHRALTFEEKFINTITNKINIFPQQRRIRGFLNSFFQKI